MATPVVCLGNSPTPPRLTNSRRQQWHLQPNRNLRRSRLQPKQRLTEDTTIPYKNKPAGWGNVRILKRGDTLPASLIIKKESRFEETTVKETFFFAGTGFFASPSPSSLPLPNFLARKQPCNA